MKKRIKNIFKAYILLNIHVALAVVSLYAIFNQSINTNYLLFLFFSTILSYNLIRLMSFGGNRFFVRIFFARFKKIIVVFLGIVTLCMFYFYFHLDLMRQVSLIPLFLITFLYNFELILFPKLRQFGLIKILLVAFVWAGVTVIVPKYHNLDTHTVLQALFVFLFVSLLTLGFDQRDILIDSKDLKTIPKRFKKHLWIIYLIFFILLTGINFSLFQGEKSLISEIIITAATILSYRSTNFKSFYYTAFWIEALPIFWFILLNFLHQL